MMDYWEVRSAARDELRGTISDINERISQLVFRIESLEAENGSLREKLLYEYIRRDEVEGV